MSDHNNEEKGLDPTPPKSEQEGEVVEKSGSEVTTYAEETTAGIRNTVMKEELENGGMRYVFERHGTVDLIPLPSESNLDPLNWPNWRKNILLGLVSFQACLSMLSGASLIPAYVDFAQEFDVSLTQASYFTSVQILFIGIAPVFWAPLSSRYGRRPIYLISTIVGAATSFAGAYCHSYGSFMTTRVFHTIFISTANGIGPASVREMFFRHNLGQKIGIYTLAVTLAPPIGPLMCGFIVTNKGWKWILYLLAILQLVLFFLYLFFGPETLFPYRPPRNDKGEEVVDLKHIDAQAYHHHHHHKHLPDHGSNSNGSTASEEKTISTFTSTTKEPFWHAYFKFGRISKKPFEVFEFVEPAWMLTKPVVVLPAFAYAIVFAYTSVLLTVLVPQFFVAKFHLDEQQIGLQFISLIIGSILGEQIGGWGSDLFMKYRLRTHAARFPELRLAISYPGFLLGVVGVVIWGVQLQNATEGKWNVTPDIGSGIAAFACQVVTTVVYAYCLESYPAKSTSVAAAISLVRQIYGFTVPFYVADGERALGDAGISGLLAGITGVSVIGVILPEIWGRKWRRRDPDADHS